MLFIFVFYHRSTSCNFKMLIDRKWIFKGSKRLRNKIICPLFHYQSLSISFSLSLPLCLSFSYSFSRLLIPSPQDDLSLSLSLLLITSPTNFSLSLSLTYFDPSLTLSSPATLPLPHHFFIFSLLKALTCPILTNSACLASSFLLLQPQTGSGMTSLNDLLFSMFC